MKKKYENSNSFENFKIPDNYFERLFEFTGNQDETSKGFIVAYVNQEGYPLVYTKVASPIVEMGLIKALEQYLDESGFEENSVDNYPD